MNWYKCSNGDLLNLERVVIIAVNFRGPDDYRVKAHFEPEAQFFAFPDTFATREAAVQFIAELYEEMAV
mgnify:CR=1 FL=1